MRGAQVPPGQERSTCMDNELFRVDTYDRASPRPSERLDLVGGHLDHRNVRVLAHALEDNGLAIR